MARNGTITGRLAIAAAVLVASSACGSGHGAEAQDDELFTFNIVYTDSANTAAIILGNEQGFFADRGIDLQQLPPASTAGSSQVALLLNGQAHATVTDVTAVPAAVSKGLDVEIIASVVADYESPTSSTFATIVAPDSGIESFRDLEGRTVGVNGLGGFWELEVREAVRLDGGDPDLVEIVAVDIPNQAATLQQGRVDAVSTLQPFITQLQMAGFRSLGDPAAIALGQHSVGTTLMSATTFTRENPEVLQRFLEGYAEAVEYANAHPEEVRSTIARATSTPMESVAEVPLPWYVSGVSRDSAVDFMELMVRYGALDEVLPVEDIVWPEAPDAELGTPPAGITVRG